MSKPLQKMLEEYAETYHKLKSMTGVDVSAPLKLARRNTVARILSYLGHRIDKLAEDPKQFKKTLEEAERDE